MQSKEELIQNIQDSIRKLSDKHDLTFDETVGIIKDRQEKELPLSIFNNEKLSSLETITKYLKENLDLNYKQIASLLGRNYDPIAITYRNSKKKLKERLDVSSDKGVPVKIFRNKPLSVLENLAVYLKEQMKLSYREISRFLNRDERTIWTAYQRALKKRRWR